MNWNTAPNWAKYRATDQNGNTHYYECEPGLIIGFPEWTAKGGRYTYCGKLNPENWKQSLIRR